MSSTYATAIPGGSPRSALSTTIMKAPGLLVKCAVADGRFEVRSFCEGDGASMDAMVVNCSGEVGTRDEWVPLEHALLRAQSATRCADVSAL